MVTRAQLQNTTSAKQQQDRALDSLLKLHAQRIAQDLRALGADAYDMLLPEASSLPLFINADERVLGAVFGRYHLNVGEVGRGALVATDKRILLLDKKPLFTRCDEITYDVISAVTYSKVGPAGTITLHTRMGDVRMRTFNKSCATSFVAAVESKIFSRDAYGFSQPSYAR